ncbi:hypothetical protein AO718_05860 [Aeromonas veronii]|nr:hypothetical protein AO718_05860 [Aeromonas veronii]KRW02762.1 hypothetical protein AO725_14550 [Aeromonas veronii]KRW09919.1 hypothetical protein AO732_04735 [Aeromonas veronii]KRW10371.1 hypothetical protein AO745_03145 [Aeromonas veronii]KRW20078.1 hypothetical protein AO734_04075 [Aeromonas veronii]
MYLNVIFLKRIYTRAHYLRMIISAHMVFLSQKIKYVGKRIYYQMYLMVILVEMYRLIPLKAKVMEMSTLVLIYP